MERRRRDSVAVPTKAHKVGVAAPKSVKHAKGKADKSAQPAARATDHVKAATKQNATAGKQIAAESKSSGAVVKRPAPAGTGKGDKASPTKSKAVADSKRPELDLADLKVRVRLTLLRVTNEFDSPFFKAENVRNCMIYRFARYCNSLSLNHLLKYSEPVDLESKSFEEKRVEFNGVFRYRLETTVDVDIIPRKLGGDSAISAAMLAQTGFDAGAYKKELGTLAKAIKDETIMPAVDVDEGFGSRQWLWRRQADPLIDDGRSTVKATVVTSRG